MEKFKQVMKHILITVIDYMKDKNLPRRNWIHYYPDGDGPRDIKAWFHDFPPPLGKGELNEQYFSPVERVDYKYVLDSLQRLDIEQLQPHLDHLIEIVRTDKLLADNIAVDFPSDSSQRRVLFGRLSNLFLKYFEENGHVYNEDQFDVLLEKFIKELKDKKIVIKTISPLQNMILHVEQMEFSPHIILRKLNKDDFESWINWKHISDHTVAGSFPHIHLRSLQCAIEVTCPSAKFKDVVPEEDTFYFNHQQWWEDHKKMELSREKLIALIRLLFERNVYCSFSESYTDSILFYLGRQNLPRGWFFDEPVVIDDKKAERLQKYWGILGKHPSANKIELALRRWDHAIDRLSNEDKIIDYWIAIETLMFPERETKIKETAANRIAAFFGDSQRDRMSIYKKMKRSYDIRCEIVHGNHKFSHDIQEVEQYTRKHLRKIIIKILQLKKEYNPSKFT